MAKSFSVYPEYRKLYLRVTVFDTEKEMLQEARKIDKVCGFGKLHKQEQAALTIPVFATKSPDSNKLLPLFGFIFFCKELRLDTVVIAHEAMHAALLYTKRLRDIKNIKLDILGEDEERITFVQTNIMEQILKKNVV
jgi:hypothetical protein